MRGDANEALETARECLELQEKYENRSDIAYTLQVLGAICMGKGEYTLALDYTSRSVTIFEEIGDKMGLGTSLGILGSISYMEGKLNQAVKYCKQSLSFKMISNRVKADNLNILGQVYSNRGEINKALGYYKKGIVIAEKANVYDVFIRFQIAIGSIFLLKGEYDLAIEYLENRL
ncbi:MAG: Photosystem I assembly protein Ycf3, partial [Candidatus Lokiarchaeum sp. GC14_75]